MVFGGIVECGRAALFGKNILRIVERYIWKPLDSGHLLPLYGWLKLTRILKIEIAEQARPKRADLVDRPLPQFWIIFDGGDVGEGKSRGTGRGRACVGRRTGGRFEKYERVDFVFGVAATLVVPLFLLFVVLLVVVVAAAVAAVVEEGSVGLGWDGGGFAREVEADVSHRILVLLARFKVVAVAAVVVATGVLVVVVVVVVDRVVVALV